ncbi:MAG: phosphate--acyl-ACP acyltransferase, partial [Alistipes sp.]|nr:phosphate--acyl-ACP acyltransferase [Alistipes sp.]
IGEEAAKGNAQAQAAYQLMEADAAAGKYNFVGNVESSYIFTGKIADVIICDGFVGNTVLKMAEGLYQINLRMGLTNEFWEQANYENFGGTPVLGVNAPVTIGHGKSTPKAIMNMIISTEHTIESNAVGLIKEAFIG